MLPLLKYTVLRLALFGAALWLLLLAGASPILALVGGALVSLLLSYVLLRGLREELAVEIADRVDRRHERSPSPAEEDAAFEDAADEVDRVRGRDRSPE